MKFTELSLQEGVLAGINKAGFEDCTNVQEMVLPVTLTGKDAMVQSKTGSGKTAVYLLTILSKYERLGKGTAIIVSPTRELAVQIEEDARLLSSGLKDYKIGCFYGGVGYQKQEDELKSGLNLYVGTPGRLLDFAKSHQIDFRSFDTVVLDEADRMFDMGFYPDIQKMFSMMVAPQERQTMLFSATLSVRVRNLAWQYMNEPQEFEVQPEEITVKNITQELFHVTKEEKFPLLLSILKKINPKSCLLFTNTKDKAVEVSKRLCMNGYKCEYLMGDMPQSKRLATLDRMKEGKLSFLVATDVAARGLQIDDLELVVNYDIPEDFENYVHRIGRTARAGKSGKAVTLACEEYIYGLEAIENYIQMKIPVLWPDEVGLEPVEDKSAGYHYSSRRPDDRRSEHGRRSYSSDRKGDFKKDRHGSNRRREKPVEEEKPSKEKSAEYGKLSSMSLDERMAYYKKEYNKNPKKESPKKDRKPSEKMPTKKTARPYVAKNARNAEAKAPETKPVEKKPGLLARIKAFFFKKN